MSRTLPTLTLLLLLGAAACGGPGAPPESVAGNEALQPVPRPDLSRLDAAVAEQLGAERERLDALLAADDADPDALAERFGTVGRLYLAYDLRSAAAAALTNAAALQPEELRWHYSAGLVAQRQGDWQGAAERFRRVLELEPQGAVRAAVLRRLGEVELELGRDDDARRRFAEALEVAPDCQAARYGLGEVARRQGRLEDAAAAFERVLQEQPGAVSVHYPLAQVLLRLDRPQEAEPHLAASAGRTVKVGGRPACPDPLEAELAELTTGAAAHITRGRHAAFSGRADRELAEYRRAVELAPDDPVARLSLGSALVRSGDLEAAAEQYAVAVELRPDDPDLRYDLGRILMELRRGLEARQQLLRAVELAPDHAGAHLKLAELTLSGGRYEETLHHARRAAELIPGDVRPRVLEAMALLALRRPAEARPLLSAILTETPPANPAERLRLALLLASLGAPAEAEPHLAAIAADGAAAPEIRAQARSALQQLRGSHR